MKKILFVASESTPFIKTGGLADVVGSLPKCIDKEKYDVRVMIPKYLCIKEDKLKNARFLTNFYVKLSWRTQYAGIFVTEVDGVTFYLVDNEYYYTVGHSKHEENWDAAPTDTDIRYFYGGDLQGILDCVWEEILPQL